MSLMYCEKCDETIDTDFNAEHFDDEVNGCEDTYKEPVEETPQMKGTRELLDKI